MVSSTPLNINLRRRSSDAFAISRAPPRPLASTAIVTQQARSPLSPSARLWSSPWRPDDCFLSADVALLHVWLRGPSSCKKKNRSGRRTWRAGQRSRRRGNSFFPRNHKPGRSGQRETHGVLFLIFRFALSSTQPQRTHWGVACLRNQSHASQFMSSFSPLATDDDALTSEV